MTFLINTIIILVVLGLAWFSSTVGVYMAIRNSTSVQHMVRRVYNDVYACVIVGTLFYLLVPMGYAVIFFLGLRLVFMSIMDWHTIVMEYEMIMVKLFD